MLAAGMRLWFFISLSLPKPSVIIWTFCRTARNKILDVPSQSGFIPTFEPSDRVRVDITDITDPDFDWHGEDGKVVDALEDDAGEVAGDDRDSLLYRVELDKYDQRLDFRHRDLRPPFEG